MPAVTLIDLLIISICFFVSAIHTAHQLFPEVCVYKLQQGITITQHSTSLIPSQFQQEFQVPKMEESWWRWYFPDISRVHGDNSNIPWQIFGIIPYTRTASPCPFHFGVFFLHVNENVKKVLRSRDVKNPGLLRLRFFLGIHSWVLDGFARLLPTFRKVQGLHQDDVEIWKFLMSLATLMKCCFFAVLAGPPVKEKVMFVEI